MVVVADTSPINYLILIAQIDLLAALYTRILIPSAVLAELKYPLALKWLEVLSPRSILSRQEALRRGLKVPGTLSVLNEADQAGLVIFDDAVAELRKTSFRVSALAIAGGEN